MSVCVSRQIFLTAYTLILVNDQTIGLAVLPFLTSSALSDARHTSAAQNLAQARREAREYGLVRRAEIRKRVRTRELEDEYSAKIAETNESDRNNFRPG